MFFCHEDICPSPCAGGSAWWETAAMWWSSAAGREDTSHCSTTRTVPRYAGCNARFVLAPNCALSLSSVLHHVIPPCTPSLIRRTLPASTVRSLPPPACRLPCSDVVDGCLSTHRNATQATFIFFEQDPERRVEMATRVLYYVVLYVQSVLLI